MGQELLNPPDVRGWRGHTAWIDADRWLARERFLRDVARARTAAAGRDGAPRYPLK